MRPRLGPEGRSCTDPAGRREAPEQHLGPPSAPSLLAGTDLVHRRVLRFPTCSDPADADRGRRVARASVPFSQPTRDARLPLPPRLTTRRILSETRSLTWILSRQIPTEKRRREQVPSPARPTLDRASPLSEGTKGSARSRSGRGRRARRRA